MKVSPAKIVKMGTHAFEEPVAVLHQGAPALAVSGIVKPMKPGGYQDSSADIAFVLQHAGVQVVTPQTRPSPRQDSAWSFPDTRQGIELALSQGTRTLWANTVLSASHPLALFKNRGLWLVGQRLETAQERDDKWSTNQLLLSAGCQTAHMARIGLRAEGGTLSLDNLREQALKEQGLCFPLVLKPIRGRGSEGVMKVEDVSALRASARTLFERKRYGDALMIEEFLPGEEITVSVMPPGRYVFGAEERLMPRHWALPCVRRFNHHEGIAPYNGVVAVTQNSALVTPEEGEQARYVNAQRECERAAQLVGALAPLRVDCRTARDGTFRLFDLNMKPNMTGAGREGREEQDSLTCIAARGIGWSYTDLLLNMLRQAWPF